MAGKRKSKSKSTPRPHGIRSTSGEAPRASWLSLEEDNVDTSTLTVSSRGRRSTQYQPVYDRMRQLKKEHEGFRVAVPDGIEPRVVMNRLNMAFRKAKLSNIVQPPKGLKFDKGIEEGNKAVVVRLVRDKAAAAA